MYKISSTCHLRKTNLEGSQQCLSVAKINEIPVHPVCLLDFMQMVMQGFFQVRMMSGDQRRFAQGPENDQYE